MSQPPPLPQDETTDLANADEEGGLMSFWDHIDELRGVLLRTIAAFVIGFMGVFVRPRALMNFLYLPKERAEQFVESKLTIISTGPFTPFQFLLQLGVFGGVALGLPVLIYYGSKFISPGLTKAEKRILAPSCVAFLLLFLSGAAFAFFVVCPTYLAVSFKFNDIFGFEEYFEASKYFGSIIGLCFAMAIMFQFPLVLVVLQFLGIVTTNDLRLFRRHAVVVIVIVSAFITPGGDPLTLAFMAVPLYILFELSLIVGERVRIRKLAREAAEEAKWNRGEF